MVDISTQANLDALRQAPQDVYTPTGQMTFPATRVQDTVLDLTGTEAFGYFDTDSGIITVNGQNLIYDSCLVVGGNTRFQFQAGITLPAAPIADVAVPDGRIRFATVPSVGRGPNLPTANGTVGEFFTLTDPEAGRTPGRYRRTGNTGNAANDWVHDPFTFRDGSTIYSQRFVSADTDTDVNVGTGSTVFMANTSTGAGAGNSESEGAYRGGGGNPETAQDSVFFAGGVLRGNNSTFVYTGDGDGTGLNQQEWPGFAAIDDGYRMIIPNCTFRANTDLTTANTVMVVHLNGMVNTPGNDLSGVTFQNGQLIAPWNAVEWIRVTFSPEFAADGASVAANTHRRFALFNRGLAANFDGLWYGEFGCDYTGFTDAAVPCAWTSATNRVGPDLTAQGRIDWYLVDGDYSDAYRTNGFQATNDGHGGRAAPLPTRLITARSWNPQFRDVANNAQVVDTVIDIGDSQEYFFPQAATDFETALTHRVATTDATRYLEWYPGGTRRNGIVQVDASADSPTGGNIGNQYPVAVRRDRTDPRNYNIWSYTHQCYNPDRSVMSPLAQAGFWASSMVLDDAAERLQNVDLVSDAEARNNLGLAAATELNTTTGISLLEQLYAMNKQLVYTNRAVTTTVVANGTTLDLGNTSFRLAGNTDSSAETTALTLRSTATLAGTELFDTLTYGNFSATAPVTISNMTVSATGLTALANVTVGAGVTFDGGRIRDFPISAAGDTVNIPTATINGGTTVDLDTATTVNFTNVNINGAAADNQITISRQRVNPNQAAHAAETVRVIGIPADQQDRFVAGPGVNAVLLFPRATTINLPAVTGRYAIYNTATDTFIDRGATRNEPAAVTFSSDDYDNITDVNVYWAADGFLDVTMQLTSADDVSLNAIEDPNKSTDTLPAGTSLTTSRTDGVVTVTGVTSATSFSPTITNVYWSQLKDTADYVDAMAVSEVTEPALRLVATNRININEAVIQFASGSTPQRQEVMTNVDIRGGGALSASINLNAAQAAIGQEDAYTSAQARVDYVSAGLVTMPDVQTTIDNVGRLAADNLDRYPPTPP